MTDAVTFKNLFTLLGSERLFELIDLAIFRMRTDRLLDSYLPEKSEDLTLHLVGWLQTEFGGPGVYRGRDVSRAHIYLRTTFLEPMTPAIWFVMGSHLIAVALAASVPDAIADEIARRWMDLVSKVVPSTP